MNASQGLEWAPLAKESLKRLGYMFYILGPSDSSFKTVDKVPYYVNNVIPCFLCFMIVEQFIHLVTKDKDASSVNDCITSVGQGIFSETVKLYQRGFALIVYIWAYENFQVITLPWDSPWTWLLAFVATDFGYYVVHRMGHEVNFMWAAHQVHHSSEYYNFSTALRQSAIHHAISFYIYLPMAVVVPPPAYLVHQQFNLIYQFWIHTEIVKSIGPLEYVFNTPSHHRVHHGRNRYCIDKNYGGTLIIWDRLFGTFEAEDDKVVYGLVHPINSFNPLYTQLCHFQYILHTAWNTEGLVNKVKVFVYGPGWAPGKPRTGLIEDIPDIKAPCERYNPLMSNWCNAYVFVHFVSFTCGYLLLAFNFLNLSGMRFHLLAAFVILSMTSVGAIMDGKYYAPLFELFRCLTFFVVDAYLIDQDRSSHALDFYALCLMTSVRVYFVASAMLWATLSLLSYMVKIKSNKKVD